MTRRVAQVVVVLVALVVGRFVADRVPVGDASDAPFVTDGSVGRTVRLPYAEVRVDRVAGAASLDDGGEAIRPSGRFLVVDVTLRATHEQTTIAEMYLLDSRSRRYVVDDLHTGCAASTTLPTGVTWHARLCFDVPQRAVRDARLVVARGDYDNKRYVRDAVAEIDLGLTTSRATAVWASDDELVAAPGGEDPVEDGGS